MKGGRHTRHRAPLRNFSTSSHQLFSSTSTAFEQFLNDTYQSGAMQKSLSRSISKHPQPLNQLQIEVMPQYSSVPTDSSMSFFKGGSLKTFKVASNLHRDNRNLSSKIAALPDRDIDSFLHRSQMSLDVADQIRRLNMQIVPNDSAEFTPNSAQADHLKSNRSMLLSRNGRQGLSVSGLSTRANIDSKHNQPIENSTSNLNFSQKTNRFRNISTFFSSPEVKAQIEDHKQTDHQSANATSTHNNKEYHKDLLKLLYLCDTKKLDGLAKQEMSLKRTRLDEERNQAHTKIGQIRQDIQNQAQAITMRGTNHLNMSQNNLLLHKSSNNNSRITPNLSKLSLCMKDADQNHNDNNFSTQIKHSLDWKQFFSHFDSAKKDIARYAEKQEGIDRKEALIMGKTVQSKPFFKKITSIRPDVVFNINQMLRVQRMRENQEFQKEARLEENIEFTRKRNQIEVIKQNSSKIKHLRVVADDIQKQIGGQNGQIDVLVDRLIDKFELKKDVEIMQNNTHAKNQVNSSDA